jgi:hypothetical protein
MFDDDTGTVFRDVVTLALAGFVAIVILLLPWINPPGKDAAAEVDLQGDVMVEATWEGGLDIDVDQWVEAPRLRPVGYSNKSGEACNLLRDDLGRDVDPSPANHEVTICRGIRTNGEYVVNLHLYRNRLDLPLPLPVEVRVTVRPPGGEPTALLRATVELDRAGRELTVARFRLDDQGAIVQGSLHDLYKRLRTRTRT